ncbi:hypothetical protein [Allokutzneria albata]|uniref:Uncharacterized protein n=1 Tax=Allokutzneria albata TaxID=211114 RepID=A0A1H0BKC6_ALLAB|nr:hypothetical protein [Allokutzneria albata]SDN46114.1 hypothetical protein SAMN04489726_6714 [Allokutzneria albata]
MNDQRWWVDCGDPFGRDRSVTVLVEEDQVLVVAPPGGTAVLSAQQTHRLHRTLGTASDAAAETGDPRG